MKYTTQNTTVKLETIKLGVDVHVKSYVIVMQEDGSNPKKARRMSPEQFIVFVEKQLKRAEKVYCCYEAGPFGYGLHRKLTEMGVINYVVAPQILDERRRGVKTDSRDALELCQRLDRYIRGNKKAFSVVTVPTIVQQRERSESRQREQIVKERKRLQAMGRCLLLFEGIRVTGRWWESKRWHELCRQLDEWQMKMLEVYRQFLLKLDEKEKELTKALEKAAVKSADKILYGQGQLTAVQVSREIVDWHRFNNRRQVGSYTGACPGEYSTGSKRQLGSVTKCGNKVVRTKLVEMAWRLLRYQPEYKPIAKRYEILTGPNKKLKKKAIVAVARQLAIDLWRINTGRMEASVVGLK